MQGRGMAKKSMQKSRNKKMNCTYHNSVMTSALEILHYVVCISHGIAMMSVSHFPVSQLFGTFFGHSVIISDGMSV